MAAPRVRHPLPAVRWPTEEEAARSRWFSPIRLGRSLEAEQRTWVPAMVPWRATGEGFVTPDVLDWYGTRVACWRVDYLAGEQLALRIWVRVSDDTVLRQQIPLGGLELTLLRPPEGPRGSRHD